MSNNWVVENLENALETWNEKLSEIWRLLSESPTEFMGGGIWNVMVNIAIIRSSPQVTAAFASTKRIKSFRACSGRLISWKELN